MPRYVTTAELRGYASAVPATEQASLRRTAASRSLVCSTFLSHSSKDEDLVVGATLVLQNHGARVYVDEIDPAMPPYTSEETAGLLKRRIAQTKRFVLLASPNSKESRWVPWELGIADGEKGLERIALFPASDGGDGWVNWEYLGLYRRIAWGDLQGEPEPVWMVLDEKRNQAVTLRSWLTAEP